MHVSTTNDITEDKFLCPIFNSNVFQQTKGCVLCWRTVFGPDFKIYQREKLKMMYLNSAKHIQEHNNLGKMV
jgi:hypothetical protein